MGSPASSMSEYYDHYWSPEGFRPTGAAFRQLSDRLEPLAHPTTRWVDVGCGDGRTAGVWLRARECSYVGVDVSNPAVEQAREVGLDARLIEDAGDLPFPDGSFDGAICVEVLEHLFSPQHAAAEVLRVLRPGGAVFLTVPNVAYWRRRAELAVGRWNPLGDDLSVAEPWRDPHVRFFTPSTLARMLTVSGFTGVSIEGQDGGVVRDLPWIGSKLGHGGVSRIYTNAERRWPAILAQRLNALAFKPITS